MPTDPKITFGLIVLNGLPFVRYCLRSLYPFAHEIIVVEGATTSAMSAASDDGHSTDGTLAELERFKAEEDPRGIVQIVTSDRPWETLTQQSQAYAERATGEYLWQVDVDEFYRPEDMQRVIAMLRDDPTITAMSFEQITFWAGLDYVVDGWYLRRGANVYHRLFKWGPGARYIEHEPPTVVDAAGVDCRAGNWIGGRALARRGVRLYHYSLMFPRQVRNKCAHYANRDWGDYAAGVMAWAERNFLSPVTWPFRAHNVHVHPSWFERFDGRHPPAAKQMMDDAHAGVLDVDCRDNSDVEALLSLKSYRRLRWLLKAMSACHLPGRLYRWMMHLRYDRSANRLRWR